MAQTDQICAQCGWRNEPSARMCGGCGAPLFIGAQTQAQATSRVPAHAGQQPPSPEPFVIANLPPSPEYPQPPQHTPAPTWPTSAGPTGRSRPGGAGRSSWWRAAVITLLIFAILIGGGLGVWAGIVRPAIHQQVDSKLQIALNDAVDQIPAVPSFLTGPLSLLPTKTFTYTLTAQQADTLIQQKLPQNLPISDVQVHFQQGAAIVAYTSAGQQGDITTYLVSSGGRLSAQDTTVTGPLGWVESGDEFQTTLNASLNRIPTMYKIGSLHATNDTLTISATI